MKNNILLIAVVTIISLGVIAAVIMLSTSDRQGENESSDSSVIHVVPNTEEASVEPAAETVEPFVPPIFETEDASEDTEEVSVGAEGIVILAESLIGTEFREGGDTPDGFDNSGFIYYVLRENGYLTCPRGVSAQAEMGSHLSYDELKIGDLVFFYNESGTGAGFGGIYIGGGKMIACLMPGTSVKEVDISADYYRNNFYHGVSLS